MAKLPREPHKVFGLAGTVSAPTEFAEFGSEQAGSPLKTTDIATIQALPAWSDGWQEALFSGNKALLLEDLNSFSFEHSFQTGYILQEGVAEWHATATYYQGSLVKAADGSGDVYRSLQDNNTGNAIPGHAGNAFWAWWNPSGSGSGLNADLVDGFHANATPTPGTLLPLDGSGRFPPSVVAGAVIQNVRAVGSTYQNITQVIPADDTIPQNTEGVQILSVGITPRAASSRLVVRVVVPTQVPGGGASPFVIGAVFRDAGADAVGATYVEDNGPTIGVQLVMEFEVVAGSTSPTVFNLRVGSPNAFICGTASSRLLGGTMQYSLQVEEIAV